MDVREDGNLLAELQQTSLHNWWTRLKNTDLVFSNAANNSPVLFPSFYPVREPSHTTVWSSWVPLPRLYLVLPFPSLGGDCHLLPPWVMSDHVTGCDQWNAGRSARVASCWKDEKPVHKPHCLSLWDRNWWHSRGRQLHRPGDLNTLPPGQCAEAPANPRCSHNKRTTKLCGFKLPRLWGSLWTLDADETKEKIIKI